MKHDLVATVALRLRHNAAMSTIATAATIDERWQLLFDVIAPSELLTAASQQAALAQLQKRQARAAA